MASSTETDDFFDTLDEERAKAEAEANSKTIEDMADDGTVPGDDDTAIVIDGNTGQLSLAVGGSKPTTSEFSLRSSRVQVEGQYAKGDTVTLTVVARVDEIDFVDMHDEYGNVRATKRIHKAKPISVERVKDDGEVA